MGRGFLILLILLLPGSLSAQNETQSGKRYYLFVWTAPPTTPPRNESDRFWHEWKNNPEFRLRLEDKYIVRWIDASSWIKRQSSGVKCLPTFEGPGFTLCGFRSWESFLNRLGLHESPLPKSNPQTLPVSPELKEVGQLRTSLDKLREDHLRLVKAHNEFVDSDKPFQESLNRRFEKLEKRINGIRPLTLEDEQIIRNNSLALSELRKRLQEQNQNLQNNPAATPPPVWEIQEPETSPTEPKPKPGEGFSLPGPESGGTYLSIPGWVAKGWAVGGPAVGILTGLGALWYARKKKARSPP